MGTWSDDPELITQRLADCNQAAAFREGAGLNPNDFARGADELDELFQLSGIEPIEHVTDDEQRRVIDPARSFDPHPWPFAAGSRRGEVHCARRAIVQRERLELGPEPEQRGARSAAAAAPIEQSPAARSPAERLRRAECRVAFPPNTLAERGVVKSELLFAFPIVGFSGGAREKTAPQFAQEIELRVVQYPSAIHSSPKQPCEALFPDAMELEQLDEIARGARPASRGSLRRRWRSNHQVLARVLRGNELEDVRLIAVDLEQQRAQCIGHDFRLRSARMP